MNKFINVQEFNDFLVKYRPHAVFNDIEHKKLWDYIINYIDKLTLKDIKKHNLCIWLDDIKSKYIENTGSKSMLLNDCHACDYSLRIRESLGLNLSELYSTCIYCPFEIMHTINDCTCLNNKYSTLCDIIVRLDKQQDDGNFELAKEKALKLAQEVRDMKICEKVVCESQIKNMETAIRGQKK